MWSRTIRRICLVAGFTLVFVVPIRAADANQPGSDDTSGVQAEFPHKNNLGLDFGAITSEDYYMFALTYSRRINANWRRGISLGYSFEDNISNFNNNLYDVLSIELHQRYQPSEWYHVDFGLAVFISGSVEGGSGAKFAGLYSGVGIGWKFLFIGCNVRAGLANGKRGSEFGVVLKPLMRLVFGL